MDRLVEMYEQVASLRGVAEAFMISRSTVAKHLTARGLDVSNRITPSQVYDAVRLYKEGLSLARVGERLGYDAGTIRTQLLKHGISLRDSHGRPRS